MNPNKQYCNCEGYYDEVNNTCDPYTAGDPNPCPPTTWGNIWNWIGQNVTIGQGGYGPPNAATNYYGNNAYDTRKDYTWLYVVGGIVVIGIIYWTTKKKK
mgnify:FL=1